MSNYCISKQKKIILQIKTEINKMKEMVVVNMPFLRCSEL